MNKLINKLPLLAFVLAAFAAVAFSPKDLPMNVYGFDGTDWYLVTGPPSEETYTCEEDDQPGCLYDAVNGNPIDTETPRKFVNHGLDPIEQ